MISTPLYHPRPERWPQFTLKGLLIVVTLAALLIPWAVSEYRTLQARNHRSSYPVLWERLSASSDEPEGVVSE